MRVKVEKQKGYTAIAIKDEVIDFNNISDFRDILDENAKAAKDHILLDLSGVNYIGSVGLGMISLVSVMLSKEKRRLIVVCDTEEVKRLFHISGLYRVLEVFQDRAAAEKEFEKSLEA